MGRVATKAADNVWYRARLNASMRDDRFKSRAGAAEMLCMCESAVAETELGIEKKMPPDKAVVMAEGYKEPKLLGHYCSHDCPIGKYRVESIDCDFPTAVIRLGCDLDKACEASKELREIAYDGDVSEDEIEKFSKCIVILESLAANIETLRDVKLREMMMAS